MVLSRASKKYYPSNHCPVDTSRRNFLIRCCQGAFATLVPGRGLNFPLFHLDSGSEHSPNCKFHLHPNNRAQTPLDAKLLKVQAGSDEFVTEKYHDQIAATLAAWRSSLLQSPHDLQAFEKAVASDFSGSSLRPVESRLVRSGPPIEVHQNRVTEESVLGKGSFLQELRSVLSAFSKIVTAEFQVTSIDTHLPGRLHTRVRYELVGSGQDFYREQRVGHWDMQWETASFEAEPFRLRKWQALDETQSRSFAPIFTDITAHALGNTSSYSYQLLRGADYWRTVLDGACGIDIYGHNGVSVGDIDDDGFDDLYVCQPAGLPNLIYRNRGDGTIEYIT